MSRSRKAGRGAVCGRGIIGRDSSRMSKNNVFISYARSDQQWAEWLGERLVKHGFRIWTDATSVPTGESFIAELNRTIEKSDMVLALLSPSYFRSTWCQQETAAAAASKAPIIP